MIEAQRTRVLVVTNLTVLNLLMSHYGVPKQFALSFEKPFLIVR